MGNTQSSTTNWRVLRVTSKTRCSGYIRIHFDDYVTYKNGDYKFIDVDEGLLGSIRSLDYFEGNFLEVNIDKTSRENSGHTFSSFVVRHAVGQVVERSDAEGNLFFTTLEIGNEVGRWRETYAEMARQTRYENQVVQRWTSLNIPPQW